MREVWKPLPGFENIYKVSNLGKVKSFARYPNGRIIKPWLQKGKRKTGYYAINLGRKHRFLVHTLVAITFIGPANGKIINHKDGNKLNNNVNNLEWVTFSENNKHAYDLGLKVATETVKQTGTKSNVGKLSADNLKEIKKMQLNNVSVKNIAKTMKVSIDTIYKLYKNITYKGEF